MSLPILTTRRLVVRPLRPEDATVIWAYRNDPEVARFQSWDLPYPLDKANELVGEMVAAADHAVEQGSPRQIGVADATTGTLLGDLMVQLEDEGRQAEVGLTFGRANQGRGYASEALAALVGHLLGPGGLHRVIGVCDARNVASARLIERTGFQLVGRKRRAGFDHGDWVDECEYAVVEDEWPSPRRLAAASRVTLEPVTNANLVAVLALRPHPSQERFVTGVAESIAQAAHPPLLEGAPTRPWYRAVIADGEVAGFAMMDDPADTRPFLFLWRLLVDRAHQGRGIGRAVISALATEARARGVGRIRVGWHPGKARPEGFYTALGFVPTGEVEDDEVFAELAVDAST